MTSKPAAKLATTPPDDNPVVTVQFIKRTVLREVVTSQFGSIDLMAEFFDTVEGDSREQMNANAATIDSYEMVDGLGTTTITVKHQPHKF